MEIKWTREEAPKMKVNRKEELIYLSYDALEDSGLVNHGFSTRYGGVSKGIFATMNLSFLRGDQEEAVQENYRRAAEAIGFEYESLVTSDQTHTTNVRVVTEKDRGNGITKERPYTDVDGLITDVPGLTLATFYADCVPLYFLDPVHKAIGLSHSGWKGTVGKIGKRTVELMEAAFGTRPETLITAIGPSICQSCYEVSRDVIKAADEAFDSRYWNSLYYRKENGKYQLDLWRANEVVLLESGVRRENIHFPNLCTCCNPRLLFSHRASGGKRGNLGAFIGLKG